jgi:branched-subunit amino acid transport protein
MNPFHDNVYLAAVIVGMAISTVLTRTSFSLLPERFALPPIAERALRYAPTCALAAIIAPAVLTTHAAPIWSLHNDRLWAVLIGTVVFIRTRNMLALMATGLAAFTILRLWL